MFFKHALVALFAAWTISADANTVADPLSEDAHLPNLRLSPREVQDLKDNQKFPPGYVHKMVTLGTGKDAKTVPIVEADPDMLLDDKRGVKARSLAPRGSCFSFPLPSSGCMIDYCWIDSGGHTYSAAITIRGSNGQSNPSSVTSNDPSNLSLNNVFNDGYNGWFPTGHECSNSDTQIYTDHRWSAGILGTAYVNRVRCDNCNFGFLRCPSNFLQNNLIAYSNGVGSQSSCVS
ncbi:hypothetical protein FPRO05_13077 [Fusarium proliferatum]|uniref:Secreted in xylem 2 n=1 Tax=Gibberella intermedia TaxID=948311 RepID=A0A365N232_GIBIN|nr:hypothetical protein FPRO05_13077 [Fusarium proliferatum]